MNLDDVAAELLAGPLEQFTAERNTRAKELKAQGQTELAAAVAKLKKPPVHLWAANRAARQDAGLLRTLRESAQAVSKAQTGRSTNPRELRAASERFQEALDVAVKAAEQVLRTEGHAATEEAERRIREIFRATAMQAGEPLEQLKQGALLSEPAAGDDVLAMFQAGAPAPHPALPPEGGGKDARKRGKEDIQGEPDPHELRAAERTARLDAERAEQLETTARRLRAEAQEAAAQAKRADERAREAEKEAAAARAQATKSAGAVTPGRPSAGRRR